MNPRERRDRQTSSLTRSIALSVVSLAVSLMPVSRAFSQEFVILQQPAHSDVLGSSEPAASNTTSDNTLSSNAINNDILSASDPSGDHLSTLPLLCDDAYSHDLRLFSGYDQGLFIATADSAPTPFRLKVNLQNQFRFTGFAKSTDTWTDASGNASDLTNRNDFEINRGRLIFSGNALEPDLNYYLNLDYGSLGDDRVTVLMAWVNYRFTRAFDLYFGKGKVPGGREWLLTSMNTLAPDRSMATTFFRPSITAGMWAKGEPRDGLFYQALIGNGYNTNSAGVRDLDTNFVYSMNTWWEPLGEFGGPYSDLQHHEDLVMRAGTSITSSVQDGQQADATAAEETFIRLSDGTDLTQLGALAPGVSVTEYSVLLSTYDVGLKYRGFNLHGEYFLRWLGDIEGTGIIAPSRREIFDHGFHLLGGAFVVPKRLEIYARTSNITGPFGGGGEYATGFNWYLRGTENWRFCFDVARINQSPAEQIRTGYDAGDEGVLMRAQLQTIF